MPVGGGSSFTLVPGTIPSTVPSKVSGLVRPGTAAEKVAIEPNDVIAPSTDSKSDVKTRKCPKAKSYGTSINSVTSSNWDSKQLKVDYKTSKDGAAPTLHCTYTYPLASSSLNGWSGGEFNVKSDTFTAKLVPRTSLELALHSKGAARANWLTERVPDLDMSAGVVMAEAEKSRKAYVKAKYKVCDELQVNGQLTFAPESANGSDGASPVGEGQARLFSLSQSKVSANYTNSLVNVGATMQGLGSVDVDFSCSPSAWASRQSTRVAKLEDVTNQGNLMEQTGRKLHTALGEDMQLYVGGKTSYNFTKGLGSLQAAAALNRTSGGHVSLTVNNVLGDRPDYTMTTTADVGDWALAAKLQWKPSAGQALASYSRPSSFVVGAACKLDGGAKLRFRLNEEGVFGVSYARRLPKNNASLSLVMESSPKEASELCLPRVGICLKLE